jgi:diguanylate cyclase (GGDEF)-like protein
MAIFLYTEINVVGIVILLLLLHSTSHSGLKDAPLDQRIFNSIMATNILIFLLDTGMWLLDKQPSFAAWFANEVVTTLYYISNPFICFVWLLYVDYKIYENKAALQRRALFYSVPLVFSTIISLVSPFTGWYFVVDAQNRYVRGPYFPVMALVAIIYLLLASVICLYDFFKKGWEKDKSVNLLLAVLTLLNILSAMVQTLFFGVSIIWICTMLACISIYINLQNREISTDYLTGLYNRRRLDQYLQRRLHASRGNRLFFSVLLDLDEFKSINDNLGHHMGDEALVQVALLLRSACKGHDDFIARMGGDEFIIVGERATVQEIEALLSNIDTLTNQHNLKSQMEYPLLISMGYSVLSQEDTLDSFLAVADKRMYANKQLRKQLRASAALPS